MRNRIGDDDGPTGKARRLRMWQRGAQQHPIVMFDQAICRANSGVQNKGAAIHPRTNPNQRTIQVTGQGQYQPYSARLGSITAGWGMTGGLNRPKFTKGQFYKSFIWQTRGPIMPVGPQYMPPHKDRLHGDWRISSVARTPRLKVGVCKTSSLHAL